MSFIIPDNVAFEYCSIKFQARIIAAYLRKHPTLTLYHLMTFKQFNETFPQFLQYVDTCKGRLCACKEVLRIVQEMGLHSSSRIDKK